MNKHSSKCHFCDICNGEGCVGELPGMGGFSNNVNFTLNFSGWKTLPFPNEHLENSKTCKVRLGPMTGAIENIGYETEESFYFDIIDAVGSTEAGLSIGDGCPDIKLQSGILAVKEKQKTSPNTKAAVFIKPYPNSRIFERLEWVCGIEESVGIDIDSYNILTMRNLVNLEKKTAQQLKEIKNHLQVPFSIKGIFNPDEIELIKEVRPDIVIISNHGGRVENRIGSTAEFLANYGKEIKKHCGELWIDGGIRTHQDILLASAYGVNEAMIGRPFASALCQGGKKEVSALVKQLLNK